MPAPLPANCASTDYVAPLYPSQLAAPSPADATPRGPGADLIDAMEAGYFERIGASDEPSEIAGVWAEGGSVT